MSNASTKGQSSIGKSVCHRRATIIASSSIDNAEDAGAFRPVDDRPQMGASSTSRLSRSISRPPWERSRSDWNAPSDSHDYLYCS